MRNYTSMRTNPTINTKLILYSYTSSVVIYSHAYIYRVDSKRSEKENRFSILVYFSCIDIIAYTKY